MKRAILVLSFFMSWSMIADPVSITVGPESRPATLKLPSDYALKSSWPLVMVLHGYTANSSMQDSYFGGSRTMDTLGFMLLLPNGTKNSAGDRFWNATPECCDFENSGVDDVSYLKNLLVSVKASHNVDPDRVYVMGHSNGGFMGYRLACEGVEMSAMVSLEMFFLRQWKEVSALFSNSFGTRARRAL